MEIMGKTGEPLEGPEGPLWCESRTACQVGRFAFETIIDKFRAGIVTVIAFQRRPGGVKWVS